MRLSLNMYGIGLSMYVCSVCTCYLVCSLGLRCLGLCCDDLSLSCLFELLRLTDLGHVVMNLLRLSFYLYVIMLNLRLIVLDIFLLLHVVHLLSQLGRLLHLSEVRLLNLLRGGILHLDLLWWLGDLTLILLQLL